MGTPTQTSGVATPTKPMDINANQGLADEVKREKGGRMYKVVTREYLASGHDGYDMLKGNRYLIEDEGGQMMSTVVRKYLLGKSMMELLPPPAAWLKRITLHRGTVCEPNVTPWERKRSQSNFHPT